MPISSPSYFPPNRGTDQIVGITAGTAQTGARVFLGGQSAGDHSTISDLVAIGHQALAAGITDTNLAGSTVIGQGSLVALTGHGTATNALRPMVALGHAIAPSMVSASDMVLLGDSILSVAGGSVGAIACTTSVLIGNSVASKVAAGADHSDFNNNVAVGCAAMNYGTAGVPVTNVAAIQNCTAIGTFAMGNMKSGNQGVYAHADCTAVGYNALNLSTNAGVMARNVCIGSNAGNGLLAGSGNVCVGYNAGAVGEGLSNVLLGQDTTTGPAGGNYNVIIGYQSNSGVNSSNYTGKLLISNNYNAAGERTLVFGDFPSGNVELGNSTQSANRDFPTNSTNILKLINGTVGSINPLGGGYLYVNGGVLHWVDSSGVNTTLSLAAGGQLSSTEGGYTNNAAALTATLTNAPTAGNPTKWIPINDNGTIRNIPAW